jgi:hypothetical protein
VRRAPRMSIRIEVSPTSQPERATGSRDHGKGVAWRLSLRATPSNHAALRHV